MPHPSLSQSWTQQAAAEYNDVTGRTPRRRFGDRYRRAHVICTHEAVRVRMRSLQGARQLDTGGSKGGREAQAGRDDRRGREEGADGRLGRPRMFSPFPSIPTILNMYILCVPSRLHSTHSYRPKSRCSSPPLPQFPTSA